VLEPDTKGKINVVEPYTQSKINVLVIGPACVGKSSFCNSCFRYITKEPTLPMTTSRGAIANTRLEMVPNISKMSNFRLFDVPGTNFNNVQQELLDIILDGIEVPEIGGIHQDDLAQLISHLPPKYEKNRISFVVVVFSVEQFHTKQSLIMRKISPVLNFPTGWIQAPKIYAIEKKVGQQPFLVLTHKNKMQYPCEEYMKMAETVFPTDHIFFVENYTKESDVRIETDITIEILLKKMLVKCDLDAKEGSFRSY